MWQRLGRWKISCDLAVLGKVMRERWRFLVVAEPYWKHISIVKTVAQPSN
jgi:hypothetical protein